MLLARPLSCSEVAAIITGNAAAEAADGAAWIDALCKVARVHSFMPSLVLLPSFPSIVRTPFVAGLLCTADV